MHSAVHNFLNARELQVVSQTCAQARAMIAWDVLLCARFPRYVSAMRDTCKAARIRHTDAPEYNAREALLLLEDRARDGRAAVYRARSSMLFHDFDCSRTRGIDCVTNSSAIIECLYISRGHMILRGDIIIDETALLYGEVAIFDGICARQCDEFGRFTRPHTLIIPQSIRIGAEFDIEYFRSIAPKFDRVRYYLETNRANYSNETIDAIAGLCHCQFATRCARYLVMYAQSTSMATIIDYAAEHPAFLIRVPRTVSGLELDKALILDDD